METPKENKQNVPPNPQTTGIPDWVLHLLTGLGTMGAEYMMFIKPLQEKMELQSKLIKEQGERIDELEEILQSRRKPKLSIRYQKDIERDQDDEEEEDDKDNELFTIKRKINGLNKQTKNARVKL